MAIHFSPQQLDRVLSEQLPPTFSGKICVAFSGGVDSAALLHALASLRQTHPDWQIRAIHVNHQLQATSSDWAQRCVEFASKLTLPLLIKAVEVDRKHAQGLEAAARDVRYAAFAQELTDQEVLLTAHHADDQLETMLLALMRGAGVRGLSAMPTCSRFENGWHARPLLAFTRDQIQAWAREQGIDAIEDPSNRNERHDRNYLRHRVLPILRERWSAASINAVRSASHLGEASQLLDELARVDHQTCAVGACLSVAAIRDLRAERRRNLIRYWLRQQNFDAPSTRVLHAIEHDMLNAAHDRNPMIDWPDASGKMIEVHRYQGLLYAVPSLPTLQTCEWDWRVAPLQLPQGQLRIEPSATGLCAERLPARLVVRARCEGDSIELAHRPPRRLLKRLFQESSVPPWWRDRLPLLCASGTERDSIIAIADLFIAKEFAAKTAERAVQVIWDGKPRDLS
jgi:tRNA(Ile)-lysidine synthase